MCISPKVLYGLTRRFFFCRDWGVAFFGRWPAHTAPRRASLAFIRHVSSPPDNRESSAGTALHENTCRTQHTCRAAGILVPRPTPEDRGGRDAGGGCGGTRGKASLRCFSRHTSCRRAALTRINCTCACRSAQQGRCWQLNGRVEGGSSISIDPSYTTSCVSGRAAMRRCSMPIDL